MANYGVLKGKAVAFKRDDDDDPHSEVLMNVDGASFRIAINVRSSRGPTHQRLVEYLIKHDLKHPIVDHARKLGTGWHDLTDGREDGAAIDYIRSNLFRATEMKPMPHFVSGPDNDLFEYVEDLLQRAIDDSDAIIYAFGERWGPEPGKRDQYFDFTPGAGVHLIHMNQGGRGDQKKPYRDGALLFEFPRSGTVSGLFIKFQNQVWHTDERDATPLEGAPAVPVQPIPPAGTAKPWPVVAADSPYFMARIVAAMVSPNAGAPEFVTILNSSGDRLEFDDWQILDRQDRSDRIAGAIDPGHAATFPLSGQGAMMSGKGGTITLLDSRGLKVDGVAYTERDAKTKGRPVVFL
ncbi:DUF2278 family protein [Azospirillum brasilense]|uniref:DUF2278 family protein n=1 Tax=Azospirillum brasilense TaxID=192 RepID=A0A4D8QXX7_AZOBR|nr:DUF2278 family protein [Azospirillum brasilense]QCO16095.1 DUF2278 family protein [Azospirillum brasilense]